MGLFAWDDKYSVHVGKMDEQHKKLFDLINQLHEAMTSGKGNAVMAEILKGLKDYTTVHFTEEEKYLESFKYSGLLEQKKQHKMFIDKISGYEADLSGKRLGLSIDVMQFLRDWLITHIQTIDMKYSETFQNHGMK
ncbi:MAG TPA: bacteriohemerythrin [Methanospirillum sp.]|nr:bacteriohemerythrin [Methanospirillum sp.]